MAVSAKARSSAFLERASVEARFHDVDPVYAETRDIRTLGFVLFLLADCILFSSFIFAYLYLRTSAPVWPPVVDGKQIEHLDVAFGAMNSIVLFGSGVTMHFALESWKNLKKAAFNFWIVLTIALGLGFLSGQAHEYLSAPMTWTGSSFGASFCSARRSLP
jgi:cytochrome c oxidase subunit 3